MGQYRSSPDKTKKTEIGESKKLTYATSSMCGWRIYMQDAHINQPKFAQGYSLFAVFDGHGGAEVAKFAERHFAEELVANENFAKKKFETALIQTYLKIDKMLATADGQRELKKIKKQFVQKQNSDDEEKSYAGCTAVVCLITDNQIYVANVGDSRCVISLSGKAETMSIDHKPEDQSQFSRIKKAGGDVIQGRVNGNINLSRALGDLQYKDNTALKPEQQLIISKPDIKKRDLTNIDYIILGCDGIFQAKSNQEIVDMVNSRASKKSLKQTAEQMLDLLIAPSTQNDYGLDNMTLILIKLK